MHLSENISLNCIRNHLKYKQKLENFTTRVKRISELIQFFLAVSYHSATKTVKENGKNA